ncbi:MAG: AraC family transcriptional regulator [Gammaproteobacteria bacterium]
MNLVESSFSPSTAYQPSSQGGATPLPFIMPGSLAPWQVKRLRQHIEANIAQRLSIEDLARIVNLSASHFSRAFKRSFGDTVHRYVMCRRVEAAQSLMLGTAEDLSRIALTCGMSDQSHLTRWFRRVVGETPASWRRARFEPPPELGERVW